MRTSHGSGKHGNIDNNCREQNENRDKNKGICREQGNNVILRARHKTQHIGNIGKIDMKTRELGEHGTPWEALSYTKCRNYVL